MRGLDPRIHVFSYDEQGMAWMAGTSPAMTGYVVGKDIAMNDTQALTQITGTIVLAGAGKMGGAMLTGWLARGLDAGKLVVIEPAPSPEIGALAKRGVRLNPSPKDVGDVATLVVALKPQSFREAGAALKPFTASSTLVVSIMAGTPIAVLEQVCGGSAVRAMPNTPASIGRGITVAVAAKKVSAAQRAIADALLSAIGSVEWVHDENLIDAVTAVSGSGPAYVFLLAEELARAGVAAGLPLELATKLARETVAGSGELLHRSDLASATLRQNVTSPGGTTAAALEVLMSKDGLQQLMIRAVAAATRRSKELAK
jgi:pyrroline-5-carboxylate reductase